MAPSALQRATDNLRSLMHDTSPAMRLDKEVIEATARARREANERELQEQAAQAQQRTYDSLAKCSNAAMRMDILLGRLKKAQQSPGRSQDALSATREILHTLARHLDIAADQSSDVDDIHTSLGEAVSTIASIMSQIEEWKGS